ncbi:MAG: hypothetical protein AAGA70_04495 [Pseudomonadota bacterium]
MRFRVTVRLWLLLVLMASGLNAQSPAPRQGPPDLYFLTIGIGNFEESGSVPLQASASSAEVVARALIGAGARFGYVLVSRPGEDGYVTREDVRSALTQLKARIRADGALAPRIVVYAMSHGVGDAPGRQTYLLTDDLHIPEPEISQGHALRLARRAIWSVDLLATLMNFRLDPFFQELDPMLEADLFSDRAGLIGIIEHGRNLAARERRLAESRAQLGARPVDNAPVPFLLLLDNCAFGVATDQARTSRFLDSLTEQYFRATLDVGVAFQAAPFGVGAPVLPLPSRLTDPEDLITGSNGNPIPPWVGPMAVHLSSVLAARDPSQTMTLEALAAALAEAGSDLPESGLPSNPTQLPSYLRADVGRVDFLPGLVSEPSGRFEYLTPSGDRLQLCCADIGTR